MKRLYLLFIGFLLAASVNTAYSQKLSVGFHSGVNISDIHNAYPVGKWKFKPGPTQRISLDYSLTPTIGISGGISYSTLYYEHRNYYSTDIIFNPYPFYSSTAWYYPSGEMMNFSFLSLPLQLKFTIPSRPELSLAFGSFYSIALDHSYYNYYQDTKAQNDLGFIYSAGLAWPLGERMKAHFNLGYISGRKAVVEGLELMHGGADLSVGLTYNLVPGEDKRNGVMPADTISGKMFLSYRTGGGISWNSGSIASGKYQPAAGFSVGIDIGFKLSPHMNFRTGLSFDRPGFALKDSSDVYYRYLVDDNADYSVDTKVSADYITIPALLEYTGGEKIRYYLNTGPYIGVLLNARCSGIAISANIDQGSYSTMETTVYDDITELINNNDFGWMTGMGLIVPLYKNTSLDIGASYRIGLTDQFDSSAAGNQDTGNGDETIMQHSSVFLNIGLRVPVYNISK
ncbi:MAG: PorT family protein [Bacteroidales bacterium]|nr:PorT family protein [Bacteroidales bacterium]